MILKQLFGAVPVALLVLGNGAAKAGQIINERWGPCLRRATSGMRRSLKKDTG